jgi:hypothetical protein
VATNLRSYFTPSNPNHVDEHPNNDQDHQLHRQRRASAHERHSHQGSRWAKSKATCRFRTQSAQFDTGTSSFQKRTRSSSQLISVINNKCRNAQIRNNWSKLTVSAFQITQHKQAAQTQISQQIGIFLRIQGYEQAPHEKPDNCIRVIMKIVNSLGIFTNGTTINSLNKLCRQFNTNILAGCKTQADWCQASEEQQFRNVIGIGMESRSIVAYNINKRMQQNQHSGCAMMAMGCFSAEVLKTGVDPYGLGRWCWLKVGSGDKKTRIVMAYQPSGSRLSNSAGTTV